MVATSSIYRVIKQQRVNYLKNKEITIKSRTIVIAIEIIILLTILSIYLIEDYSFRINVSYVGSTKRISDLVSLEGVHLDVENLHRLSVTSDTVSPIGHISLLLSKKDFDINGKSRSYNKGVYQKEDEDWSSRQQCIESYHAAYIAACKLAGINIDYQNKVIYTGNGRRDPTYKLYRNDEILAVDNKSVSTQEDIIKILTSFKGTSLPVTIKRDNELINVDISIMDAENRNCFLVKYFLNEENKILLKDSNKDGGPSSGIMIALLFYCQLTNQKLGDGYLICGTGTIDPEGNIGQIGSVDFKTIAAHNAGVDIMFVPKSRIFTEMNEFHACQTAEAINSNVKIVPVGTLDEAIKFLKTINPK